MRLTFRRLFLKPLLCGILCGGGAWGVCSGLSALGLGGIAIGVSIGCGGAIYIFGLFLTRGIAKKDLIMLPKGQKIAKTLEKRGWM